SPAGIAEGKKALTRSSAFADRAQDLQGRGHRNITVDMQRGLLAIVGSVQHKATCRFNRAAEMHWMRADGTFRLDLELCKQLAHGERAERLVDDEPHRAGIVAVCAEIDDRPRKAGVGHLWHCD